MKEYLKHPRNKMLDEIARLVNRDRVLANYKPLPIKVLAIKVGHLGLDDLGFLLKKMQNSMYPGKIFFGSLKIKK